MAYLKKILGTQRLRKEIKTWVKPQEEAETIDSSAVYFDVLESVNDYLRKAFKSENKSTPDADSEDK